MGNFLKRWWKKLFSRLEPFEVTSTSLTYVLKQRNGCYCWFGESGEVPISPIFQCVNDALQWRYMRNPHDPFELVILVNQKECRVFVILIEHEWLGSAHFVANGFRGIILKAITYRENDWYSHETEARLEAAMWIDEHYDGKNVSVKTVTV